MSTAIAIENVQKNYGSTKALQGVDLDIRAGEFFGLLGPNGAGKTTLISCIVGLAHPSVGEVRVFGESVAKNPLQTKRSIGFSPQEVNIERFFNLRKTLEFQGGFYGLKPKEAKARAAELLEQFGLTSKANQQFFRLSGGMQKRLLVARALMGQPKILILDEPTAGVDVEQRHELWKYLSNLNRDGTTIILTTHYIDEAEALCERVGIINHGRIMELGAPKALIEKYCRAEVRLEVSEPVDAKEFEHLANVEIQGTQIVASAPVLGPTIEVLLSVLQKKPGRRVLDLNVQRGSLEEVFLKVTGAPLQGVPS